MMELVVDSLLTVAGTWDSSAELMISMSIVGAKWVSKFGMFSDRGLINKPLDLHFALLDLFSVTNWAFGGGAEHTSRFLHQKYRCIYLHASTTGPPFTFLTFCIETSSAEGFLFNAATASLPVGAAPTHTITCKFHTRYKFLLLCLPFSDRAIRADFCEGTPWAPASKW